MTERAPRPPLPYDWGDIRARLQGSLPSLLDRLGLVDALHHGKGDGARIYPLNPTRSDRRAGSFVIWIAGEGRGAWKDYATGEAGDVFDLIAYVGRLQAKIDVYWWSLEFLGLERGAQGQGRVRTLAAAEEERQRRAREAQAQAARDEAAQLELGRVLFRQWLNAAPLIGSPAEHYLRVARGLPLERLARAPDALRWADRWEHVDRDGEVHEFRHVMVAAMTRGKRMTAAHFTFLTADGGAKRPGPKSKIMVGSVKGAAIRLSRGPTGLSPSKAAAAGKLGPMALGEGIETSETVAIARGDLRVWAAGSLSLMGLLDWPACANAMVLLRDNDWQTPEAVRAFEAVHQHWLAQAKGRPVHVASSGGGSDFNDLVKGN